MVRASVESACSATNTLGVVWRMRKRAGAEKRRSPAAGAGLLRIAGGGPQLTWSRPERSAGNLHDPAAELLSGHRLEQCLVLAAHDGAPAPRRVTDGDGVRGHPADEDDRVADDRGRTDV